MEFPRTNSGGVAIPSLNEEARMSGSWPAWTISRDHRAAAQISYFVKIEGKWRKHERIAAFDHTPNDGPD